MYPGIEVEEFEITLFEDYFDRGMTFCTGYEGNKLQIVSCPTIHYGKWYHRVLQFLTFGRRFKKRYKYTVKLAR
jgi:hypothetical protein